MIGVRDKSIELSGIQQYGNKYYSEELSAKKIFVLVLVQKLFKENEK